MIMTIFAGIAEFWRDPIRERTVPAVPALRSGVRFGRPKKMADDHRSSLKG
jgi:hypothetical protein